MCFSHSQPTRSQSSLGIHPQLTRSNYADGISSEEQLRVVCLSLIWTKHWRYCVLPFLFVFFFTTGERNRLLSETVKKYFFHIMRPSLPPSSSFLLLEPMLLLHNLSTLLFLIHLCFCGNSKERGKTSSLQLGKRAKLFWAKP